MKASKTLIWVVVLIAVVGLGYALTRPAGGVAKNIGNDELRELVAGGARLIDVRSVGEYQMGHIEGAEIVPVETIQAEAQSWNRDEPLVLYCATGARSTEAMSILSGMGFKTLYNHTPGTNGWDGELTTDETTAAGTIETSGKPVFVQFTSDG